MRMFNIKNVKDFVRYIDFDEVWKKICNSEFIYDHTKLIIKDRLVIIYVDDEFFLSEINLLKQHILNEVKEYFNVDDIVVQFKKDLKKAKVNTKTPVKKTLTQQEVDNIRQEILKKHKHIEDEELRELKIALDIIKAKKDLFAKKTGEIKCSKCNEYFKQLNKEKICIICFSKIVNEEKNKIKFKILDEYKYNIEYATKIDKFNRESFIEAEEEILSYLYDAIIGKIRQSLNKEIDISQELDRYVKVRIKTDNKISINLQKEKIFKRLKNYRNKNDEEIKLKI